MLSKITAIFISIISFFYSLAGVSFKQNAETKTDLYVSEHVSPGGNAKTDELKALYASVLQRVPRVTPCPEKDPYPSDGRISALYYEGEQCLGKSARVFAYIGFPEGASEENPVPGMVLVHGGGGHAGADWVQYWADHGYAAISMDGFGQGYTGQNNTYELSSDYWQIDPESHLPMDNFASKNEPLNEQWFYYYIADILLANSILRADSRVNAEKIGLTGISWGGFASSFAACCDNRFAFAAPVYGSGFQDVSKTVWGEVFRGDGVTNVWDAKNLLPETNMPIMWFTGDNDPFFSAESATASAAAAPNGALTLVPFYPHGYLQGIELPEILRFANEQNGIGFGNIKIDELSFTGGRAVLSFTLPEDVKHPSVWVYYRFSPLEYEDGELKEEWQSKKGSVLGTNACVKVPEGAEMVYFAVVGKAGNLCDRYEVRATTGIYSASALEAVPG
ncbi:MAG: dienelactone hydrolase family protein [Clostridia bacterium]|nr:dienelactone hydrolase family protein [Clostridia bacterium]